MRLTSAEQPNGGLIRVTSARIGMEPHEQGEYVELFMTDGGELVVLRAGRDWPEGGEAVYSELP